MIAPARRLALVMALGMSAWVCNASESERAAPVPAAPESEAPTESAAPGPAAAPEPGTAVAVFSGGCFWCMEKPFDQVKGVVSTTSGYTGGSVARPSYEQVSSGGTGHRESIRVVYRPEQVSYDQLLDVFWHNVDPLDSGGQFCDRGSQYTTAIFAQDEAQRKAAEASKEALQKRFDRPIVTPIRDATTFYPAEDYHQDYYQKNPLRYRLYRTGCGRDARLAQVWGDQAGH